MTATDGFAPMHGTPSSSQTSSVILHADGGFSFDEVITSIQEKVQSSIRIAQESQKEGAGLTQILANVLAGDYDVEATQAQVKEMIGSAPMVMFTWERSPSCVNAIKAMDSCGYRYSVIRLDDPWDEGSPIRAEIGKMVGRPSVPMVFIGGEYVGGFDAGLSDQAPGLVSMAFKGTLQPKLEAAGAEKK